MNEQGTVLYKRDLIWFDLCRYLTNYLSAYIPAYPYPPPIYPSSQPQSQKAENSITAINITCPARLPTYGDTVVLGPPSSTVQMYLKNNSFPDLSYKSRLKTL